MTARAATSSTLPNRMHRRVGHHGGFTIGPITPRIGFHIGIMIAAG